MKQEPLCDKPGCLDTATCMLAVRFGKDLGAGYWTCPQHEADCFWQVTKLGLQQAETFTIVLLRPDEVEDLRISRA